ncbi:tRNA pseudouridine synthase 1, partial [Spiromyces aspiralis]
MNSDSATAAVAPDAQIASLERAAAEAAAGDKRKGEEPVHEGENQELNSQHPNQNVDSCTSELALKRAKVDGSEGEEFKKEARRPKRKVALLMSYCGTGYQGMQINRDAKTIELDLFRALAAAGAISKDNSTDLKKNAFQRAARTDKGVHAAGQVVSLKMIIEDPNIITKINSQLIDQIRVWGYVRTVGSFNSKNS